MFLSEHLRDFCKTAVTDKAAAKALYEQLKATDFKDVPFDESKTSMFSCLSAYHLNPKEGEDNGKNSFLLQMVYFIDQTLGGEIKNEVSTDIQNFLPLLLGFACEKVLEDHEVQLVFNALAICFLEIRKTSDNYGSFIINHRYDFVKYLGKIVNFYANDDANKDATVVSLVLSLSFYFFPDNFNADLIDYLEKVFAELNEKKDNLEEVVPIFKKLRDFNGKDHFKEDENLTIILEKYVKPDSFSSIGEKYASDNEVMQKYNRLKGNVTQFNKYLDHIKGLPISTALADILLAAIKVENVDIITVVADFIYDLCAKNDNTELIENIDEAIFEPVINYCNDNYKNDKLFIPLTKVIKSLYCTWNIEDTERHFKEKSDKLNEWVNYWSDLKKEDVVYYALFPLIVQPKRINE